MNSKITEKKTLSRKVVLIFLYKVNTTGGWQKGNILECFCAVKVWTEVNRTTDQICKHRVDYRSGYDSIRVLTQSREQPIISQRGKDWTNITGHSPEAFKHCQTLKQRLYNASQCTGFPWDEKSFCTGFTGAKIVLSTGLTGGEGSPNSCCLTYVNMLILPSLFFGCCLVKFGVLHLC